MLTVLVLCAQKRFGKPGRREIVPQRPWTSFALGAAGAPPPSCDQRELGLQTVAQDQGFCGSCYVLAFASGAETAYLMTSRPGGFTARSLHYSAEYILRESSYNSGCDGGDALVLAYEVLEEFASLRQNSEVRYKRAVRGDSEALPYEAVDVLYDYDSRQFGKATVALIKQYLASGLPVVGALYTEAGGFLSSLKLDGYMGGIVRQPCKKYSSDHQVVFVGYGKYKGKDVWVMKNTWGAGWGDQGYFYVEIGSDAYCVEHFAMSLIPRGYGDMAYVQGVVGESGDNPYRDTVRRGQNGLDFDDGTYYSFRLSGTFSAAGLIFAILLPGLLAGTFTGWWRGQRISARRYGGLVK